MGKSLLQKKEGNATNTTKTLPFERGITLCTKPTDWVELHIFADMIGDLNSNSNNETHIHNLLFCL